MWCGGAKTVILKVGWKVTQWNVNSIARRPAISVKLPPRLVDVEPKKIFVIREIGFRVHFFHLASSATHCCLWKSPNILQNAAMIGSWDFLTRWGKALRKAAVASSRW